MSYEVLNTFKEKEHKNTVYKVGDTYPGKGFRADQKRVSFLQEKHPVYGVRFLDVVKNKEPEKKSTTEKKKSDAK